MGVTFWGLVWDSDAKRELRKRGLRDLRFCECLSEAEVILEWPAKRDPTCCRSFGSVHDLLNRRLRKKRKQLRSDSGIAGRAVGDSRNEGGASANARAVAEGTGRISA